MILIPGKTYKERYPGGWYLIRTLIRINKGNPVTYDWKLEHGRLSTNRQQDVDSLINRNEIEECT